MAATLSMPVLTKPDVATSGLETAASMKSRRPPFLTGIKERVELYQSFLQRRLDRGEKDLKRIKMSRPGGAELRSPGRSFSTSPQICFQEKGQIAFELPGETVVVSAGEVMLLPVRIPYREQPLGRGFLNLNVTFRSRSVSIHLGFLENGRICCGPVDHFNSVDHVAAVRYVEEMIEIIDGDILSRKLRGGLYVALLTRIIQGLSLSSIAAPVDDEWIIRCKEIIDSSYCNSDFSVAFLARQLKCSPDHISRRFRAQTGCRIMEAVHRQRIDRALRLLSDSDMNVATIARTCGFSQPSYFNRIFKELVGTTPQEFRQGDRGAYLLV
jgi:AraC-like DNA-binding protein